MPRPVFITTTAPPLGSTVGEEEAALKWRSWVRGVADASRRSVMVIALVAYHQRVGLDARFQLRV